MLNLISTYAEESFPVYAGIAYLEEIQEFEQFLYDVYMPRFYFSTKGMEKRIMPFLRNEFLAEMESEDLYYSNRKALVETLENRCGEDLEEWEKFLANWKGGGK